MNHSSDKILFTAVRTRPLQETRAGQNGHSSGRKTSFYPWFQMPCGTSGTAGIAITAPIWDDPNDLLAFKMIQTNFAGDLNVCTDDYTDCSSPDSMNYIEDIYSCTNIPNWSVPFTVSVAQITNSVSTSNPNSVISCQNGIYRTPYVSQATTVKITPNPANDFVEIKLNGKAIGLKVILTDFTGRKVAALFDGDTEEQKLHISLPPLAAGLYIATIELTGKKLPAQKIIINN